DPSKLIQSAPMNGQVESAGTDAQAIIWDMGTGEIWEFHRLKKFKFDKEEGGHKVKKGEWKFGFGGYHAGGWNAFSQPGKGFTSASGVYVGIGLITFQDIVEVLRGGKI